MPVPYQVAEGRLTPNLSLSLISTIRWMLRRHSASSKPGWLSNRRAKVSMISPGQAGAAWALHRQDEGKSELGVVVGVQALDARKLVWRAVRSILPALFVGGFGGQRVVDHGLAGEFRVGANQCQLGLAPGLSHDLRHDLLQCASE